MMQTILMASLALALAALAKVEAVAAPSVSQVNVVDRAEHFQLDARTRDALIQQLWSRGPRHESGRHAWGFTSWEFDIKYVLEPAGVGCSVAAPAVRLNVITILPDWRPSGRVSVGLSSEWARMLGRLQAHEATHREQGVAAASRLARELTGDERFPDCAVAERVLKRMVRAAVRDATLEGRRFDRRTNYGARAGVRLGGL